MSIPESRVERTVLQVHDHVQLGVQSNNRKCDQREAGGSRQEVRQDGKVT